MRARVWGYLEKVNFKEGALVKKGDVLYEIDPRAYKDQYDAKKAQVDQNDASLKLAKVTNERFKALAKKDPGAVSSWNLDKYKAEEDQAIANLELANANLKTARLNLEWTKITALISGRISRTSSPRAISSNRPTRPTSRFLPRSSPSIPCMPTSTSMKARCSRFEK